MKRYPELRYSKYATLAAVLWVFFHCLIGFSYMTLEPDNQRSGFYVLFPFSFLFCCVFYSLWMDKFVYWAVWVLGLLLCFVCWAFVVLIELFGFSINHPLWAFHTINGCIVILFSLAWYHTHQLKAFAAFVLMFGALWSLFASFEAWYCGPIPSVFVATSECTGPFDTNYRKFTFSVLGAVLSMGFYNSARDILRGFGNGVGE